MNFNSILSAIFGNKSSRDIKKIQPLVDKVKEAYPAIQALSNDELRAKSKEIQQFVQGSVKDLKSQIDTLKAKIEETSIDEREPIFNQIDKLEKEVLDKLEEALDEVYPVAFSIVKETARRFSENEETWLLLPTSTASWLLTLQRTLSPSTVTRRYITTTGLPAATT